MPVIGLLFSRLENNFHRFSYQGIIKALLSFFIGLSFLVPLVYYNSLPYGMMTARAWFFRVVVEIIFILYVLLVLDNRSYKPRFSLVTILVFLLFLCLTISSLFNGTIIYSFWSNLERMDGLIGWGHLAMYFFVLSQYPRSQIAWQRLLQIIAVVGFMAGFVGISQILGRIVFFESAGGVRITATFGNAVYAAAYFALSIFFSLYIAVWKKATNYSLLLLMFALADFFLAGFEIYSRLVDGAHGPFTAILTNIILLLLWFLPQLFLFLYQRSWRSIYRYLIWIIIIGVQLYALRGTDAEGGIYAVLGGLIVIVLIWFYTRKKIQKIWKIILTAFIGLSCAVMVLVAGNIISADFMGLKSVEEKVLHSPSLTLRQYVWQVARQGWQEKKWLGWGMENFDLVFDRYYQSQIYEDDKSAGWYDKAHNMYWQYLIEGGLIGLALFIIIFMLSIRTLIRLYRQQNHSGPTIILFGFGAAYLISSIIYFDTLNSSHLFFFWLAMINYFSVNLHQDKYAVATPLMFFNKRYVFPAIIIIGGIFVIYNFNLRQFISVRNITALINQEKEHIGYVDEELIRRLDIMITNTPYLGKHNTRSALADLAKVQMVNAADKEGLKRFAAIANKHLLRNTEKRIESVRPYVELENFYIIAGELNQMYWREGLKIIDRVIMINTERDKLSYLKARLYSKLGDIENSRKILLKVLESDPHNVTNMLQYYRELLVQQDLRLAEDYYQQALLPEIKLQSKPEYFMYLGRDKFFLHDYQEVIKLIDQIGEEYRNQEHYQLLSVSYYKLGQEQKAREYARQAIKFEPKSLDFFREFLPGISGE